MTARFGDPTKVSIFRRNEDLAVFEAVAMLENIGRGGEIYRVVIGYADLTLLWMISEKATSRTLPHQPFPLKLFRAASSDSLRV